MGVEIVGAVLLGIAVFLGIGSLSSKTVEPQGVHVPRQGVSPEVLELLNDWELVTRDVESFNVTSDQRVIDIRQAEIKLQRMTFSSTDKQHWQMALEPTAVDSSDISDQGAAYRVESNELKEIACDGIAVRFSDFIFDHHQHVLLEEFPNKDRLNVFSAIYVSQIHELQLFQRLFAGFTAAEFLGRFNITKGPKENWPADRPVHHLVFEPHHNGANSDFLRYTSGFEILLDRTNFQPVALKFSSNERTSILVVRKIETAE